MKNRTFLVTAFLVAACASSPEPATPAQAPAPPVTAPPAPAAVEATPKVRLPADTRPTAETLELHIDPKQDRFSGVVDLAITLDHPRAVVWLHGKGFHVARATATPDGRAEVTGTWKQEDDTGIASLRFAQPLPAGKAKLHIEYDAPFGSNQKGLYRVTQAGSSYAFTQLEEIAARTAFPCFDEPGFKIPFDVTLVVPGDAEAIANTREADRKTDGSNVRVHFTPTMPLPSYLLAFAVGPLDVVPAADVPANAVRKRPLPLRAVTMKGHGKDITYALAHTADLVALLELYFGIEYPFDKLDIIAVGDKGGAMENAGAITFDDDMLLFDEKTAPIWQKRLYADVMTHELAHQWVGDLVTAAWWDDIWLNEAFATWLAAKIADQWDPNIHQKMALLDDIQGAIGSDSLVSARSIRQPIESTDDIENAFDGITYQKGAAVLCMFERSVGDDKFRQGLHDHLQAHRFGTATADDFLDAESKAAGRDVKAAFHTFLDQPGVPFVEAEVKCDGTPRLHLKQSRYLPLGSAGDPNRTWQIPICARYQIGDLATNACTVLTDREGDLPLGKACPDWLLPNWDAAGYYRFSLAPADLAKLRTKGFTALNARERVAYANSLRAAYNRGTVPVKDLLEAAAALATDPHREIAGEPMGFVKQARDWLFDDPKLRAATERYTETLYKGIFQKLGWKAGKGEDPDKTQLRSRVLSFLTLTAQDGPLRAEARRRGLAYIGYGKDGKIHHEAIDPDLAVLALEIVGQEADRRLWDAVKAQLAKTEDPAIRYELVTLLTAAKKPDLVPAVLDLALDPALRPTETTYGLWTTLRDHETRDAGWAWLKANFDKLATVVSKNHGQGQLIQVASDFCDDAHAKEVESFFTPERVATIDGGPRVLASTLEDIHLCIAKRNAQEASAREFFAKK